MVHSQSGFLDFIGGGLLEMVIFRILVGVIGNEEWVMGGMGEWQVDRKSVV